MYIGFDRDRIGRQRELTGNTQVKGKTILEVCSSMLLVLHNTKKAPYVSGQNFTHARKNNDASLNNYETIDDAAIISFKHSWYVPHYTPSISVQCILSKQIPRKRARSFNILNIFLNGKCNSSKYGLLK